jgi:hypothetical protein
MRLMMISIQKSDHPVKKMHFSYEIRLTCGYNIN